MNILLLEDNGVTAYYLREDLEEEGHVVHVAGNVSAAKTYWRQEEIDCIIADLNMDPNGLDAVERGETLSGLLTGWVWLRNHVFAENNSMKKRTIILTGYMKELKNNISEEELVGIRLVAKNPLTHAGLAPVSKHVRAIANRMKYDDRT